MLIQNLSFAFIQLQRESKFKIFRRCIVISIQGLIKEEEERKKTMELERLSRRRHNGIDLKNIVSTRVIYFHVLTQPTLGLL